LHHACLGPTSSAHPQIVIYDTPSNSQSEGYCVLPYALSGIPGGVTYGDAEISACFKVNVVCSDPPDCNEFEISTSFENPTCEPYRYCNVDYYLGVYDAI